MKVTGLPGQIEKEIRDCFARMGEPLATTNFLGCKLWDAKSQYGYTLATGFRTQSEAEAHTIKYYSERMNLIRQ